MSNLTTIHNILSVREEVSRVMWQIAQGHAIEAVFHPANVSLTTALKRSLVDPLNYRHRVLDVICGPGYPKIVSLNGFPKTIYDALIDVRGFREGDPTYVSPQFVEMIVFCERLAEKNIVPSTETLKTWITDTDPISG